MAVVDDAEPVGEAVGLLHVLRRQEDSHPLLVEPAEVVPHRGAVLGIQAGRGLVEEQHLGMRNKGHREVQALAHSARVGPGAAVRRLFEVNRLQHLRDSPVPLLLREMIERALEAQVLSTRKFVVNPDFLGRISYDLADAGGILVYVDPVHKRGARRLLDERRDHLDRGGLPRSVRAEESENLAAADLERYSIDRADVRVVHLHQILHMNDRVALSRWPRRCDGGTPRLRDARRGLGGDAAPQRSVGFKGAGFLLLEHARTWWTSLVGAPNRAAESHGRDMSESRVHREISLRGTPRFRGPRW